MSPYSAEGEYDITFRVEANGRVAEATTHFTVTNANATPEFAPISGWRVFEGEAIEFRVFAFDPDNPQFVPLERNDDGTLAPPDTTPPTVSYRAEQLPRGATFDADTGLFQWIPGYTTAGTHVVAFHAEDDGDRTGIQLTSSIDVTIEVLNRNGRPTIEPIDNVTMRRGEVLEVLVESSDPDGNEISLQLASSSPGFPLPTFVAFTDQGDGTGIVSIAPGNEPRGDYGLRLIATDDGDGEGTERALTESFDWIVTIETDNEAPRWDGVANQVAVVGQPYSLLVRARDVDETVLELDVMGLPDGAVWMGTGAFGAALLQWTPSNTDIGRHALQFTATDDGNGDDDKVLADVLPVIITVRNDNAPPSVEYAPSYRLAELSPLDISPVVFDPDLDPLTFSIDPNHLPIGATLDPLTGRLHWTPQLNQSGRYPVTVAATDGSATAVGNFEIVVENLNRPPQLVPMSLQVGREGNAMQFVVAGGDPDAGDVATLRPVSELPAGVEFDPTSGQILWTPAFDQAGEYIWSFELVDQSGASDTLDVMVRIANVNMAPQLATSHHATTPGSLLRFPIVAEDPDDHATLSYGADNLPEGASVDATTGIVEWVPGPTQRGDYLVSVWASDGIDKGYQTIVMRATPTDPARM